MTTRPHLPPHPRQAKPHHQICFPLPQASLTRSGGHGHSLAQQRGHELGQPGSFKSQILLRLCISSCTYKSLRILKLYRALWEM